MAVGKVQGEVRVPVHPTESLEKVEAAVGNVLSEIPLNPVERGGLIVLEGRFEGVEALRPLRDLFRRTRIRDAAKAHLTRIAEGDSLSFGLNKQAAYANRASFYRSRESPLGPIQITIREGGDEAIKYLCGRGRQG